MGSGHGWSSCFDAVLLKMGISKIIPILEKTGFSVVWRCCRFQLSVDAGISRRGA
jgi:hypothetical protein